MLNLPRPRIASTLDQSLLDTPLKMGNVAADGVCQHKSSAPQGRDCALSSPGHRKGRAHSPAGAGDCRAGLRFRLQPVGALDRYAFSRAGYSTRTSCYLGPAGNGLGTHENTCMALDRLFDRAAPVA